MKTEQRFLLKLSGETFKCGDQALSAGSIARYGKEIRGLLDDNPQVKLGIVIGGGNILRGAAGEKAGFSRVNGDDIGMLGTVINAVALKDILIQSGVNAEVFTPFAVGSVAELFSVRAVDDFFHYRSGQVAVFGGGLGSPYFSTDTVSVIRALQIGAGMVFKGTKVDGVYDKDPVRYSDAKRYSSLTFEEALEKKLRVMDFTAFSLSNENNLKIVVFDSTREGGVRNILSNWKESGTLVYRQN